MYNPESVLENETHTNGSPNFSQTTRPRNNQQKKKKKMKTENLPYCRLCCPGWPQSKIEKTKQKKTKNKKATKKKKKNEK